MKKYEEAPSHNEDSRPIITTTATTHPNLSQKCAQMYILKQHVASFLANIPSLSSGIALAWSANAVSVLLGQVKEDPQPLHLSLEQASWVGAVVPLTSAVGALVAAPLADNAGRKGALLLAALPTLLGWLLIMFAGSSLWLLLVGRALTGVAMGMTSGPASLYCEEISHIKVRGALGMYQFMMISLGVVWMYGIGCLLPYFWFTTASLLPSLLFVMTFSWVPESPAFLAARGRHKDAHKALRWLRGPEIDCDLELEMLLASKSKTSSNEVPKIPFLSLWSRRPWRSTALRSVSILLALMIFQQMCGSTFFVFYAVQVFQEADGSISSHLSSFIIGSVTSVSMLFATSTVDRIGRRIMLSVSFALMGVCLVFLSVYTYFKNNDLAQVEGWRWIPLAALTAYFIIAGVSVGPIPWCLMAEMLPMYAKGWGSSAVVCMNRISMFLVTKYMPLMLTRTGDFQTYIIFSISCFLAAVFVHVFIPETKCKLKADILKTIGGDYP